jgi:hypothetical protein
MRLLGFFAAFALAAACQVAAFIVPAPAQDMQMTTCSVFTSVKWVSPMDTNESGMQYQVTLTQHDMTCDQAITWAKQLIPQHIDGKPMMPSYPPLSGGPPGYACKGSPDITGHAYRGGCLKKGSTTVAPGFTWTNHATP